MIKEYNKVRVFAPATSANVSVGFDILGFPINALGDVVTLTRRHDPGLVINAISGGALPYEVEKNTATQALRSLLNALHLTCGFSVEIQKGIPLCSGLGGSAASAVAALVALNHFLEEPLTNEQLIEHAVGAEAVASGDAHADNVVPCLWGQFTLVQSIAPLHVIRLPMPKLYCVIVHPKTEIATQAARAALNPTLPLKKHIQQSAKLAAFISALYEQNWHCLKTVCEDQLIEPQRAHLLTGFYDVKRAALTCGALACSFSGAGPTMYALTKTKAQAVNCAKAMQAKFKLHGLESQYWLQLMAEAGPVVIGVE